MDYKSLYLRLFASLADAVEAIEGENYLTAKQILVEAMVEAEELYLSYEE